ncbi:MAG: PQQ-binding-like beta-propeller repeat protein [Bacteroides sp.]|nr:PQQ-binding-like beta-propeller repeat protein [Bacteroides sp.]
MEFLGAVLLPAGTEITSLTCCGPNRLVGYDRQGQYIGIDTLTGNIRWQSEEKGAYSHPLYVAQEGLLYSGCNKRSIVATDPETGRNVWSVPVPLFYSGFVAHEDLLIFHSDDTIYAMNRATGKAEWQTRLPACIQRSGLLIRKGYIWAPCAPTHHRTDFQLIDISSGKISHHIETPLAMKDNQQAIATEEHIWFCTEKGTIAILDPVTETAGEVSSTLFSENGQSQPVQIKGFQYIGQQIWFRPDTLYYPIDKNGIYTCNKYLNIQQISSAASGFEEEGLHQDGSIYHLNTIHHCVTRFSLTTLKNEQLRFPRFGRYDRLVCMALLPNGIMIVVQQGGMENDNRQIIHAIR